MNIVFLGPPGSGKGTQAKTLAAQFKLTHLSTGDVFREAIATQTPLGVKIKFFVDSGRLVPDDLVSEVVFEKLRSMGPLASVLLDGYPRTVDQCHHLGFFIKKENFKLDRVIFFDVDSDALVKRLSARRQCPACKEVFNLVSRPPKKENICDACGGALIQRPDDKAEVVQERLHIYQVQTAPVLDFYKAQPLYRRVNASQEIDKVYDELVKAVQA